MIEAVVFDLDGTLLNTLEDIHDVVNSVFNINCIPEKSIDDVRSAVGRGVDELVRKLISPSIPSLGVISNLSEQIRQTYLNHDSKRTRPYPGITKLLSRLQEEKIPTAILTNKPQDSAEKAVSMYFSGIAFVSVNGVSPGGLMKPSLESALPVLEKLGSTPGKTLMVGDSDVDMNTAVNAGMIGVGVSWGFRDISLLLEHGADHIVENPEEILELLKR